MDSNTRIEIEPYTSINAASLSEAGDILGEVLLSDFEPKLIKAEVPLVIYGAGSLGKMAAEYFNYLGIEYLYFVDRNAEGFGDAYSLNGVKVVTPDAVTEEDKKSRMLVICTVTTPQIALYDQLKSEGWENISFYYDVCEAYRGLHPLSNGWFAGIIGEAEREAISRVFGSLADDASRAHYIQFIAWRKLRVELLFDGIEINNGTRFFIPEITELIREDEVFADCGAHEGAVTEKFIKLAKGNYKRIVAIEPDRQNIEILKLRLKNIPYTEIVEKALSSSNGVENFYDGFGFASKLSGGGNSRVSTITLDSLNTGATFIKMHLEGSELEALKGAAGTIKESRPIVEATVYHNEDGIFKIILYLMELTEDYTFYFRLHSWAGTGAVIYAIPIERNLR